MLGDRVRIGVCLVEVHRRDVRADHVEGIGLHLHLGVIELVEGVLDLVLVGADHVLDRELDHHEHVVLGLGLDIRVQLLDLQAHPAGHLLDERRLALQARSGDADELPEPLDDGAFLLLHGEKEKRHTKSFQVGATSLSRPCTRGLAGSIPGAVCTTVILPER